MLPSLIIIIGIILIISSFRGIEKEDKSFEKILEREEVNNNKDYSLEILSIRKDMAETIFELQKEIEDLKKSINNLKNKDIKIEEDVISEIDFSKKEDKGYENLKSEKQKKVQVLLDKGLTDDEICENLSIGKGEVLLIKSLLKK